jgi:cytoskeletal protein CcmA (bactofilin family)
MSRRRVVIDSRAGFSIGNGCNLKKQQTREIRVPEDCRTIRDALLKASESKVECHILLAGGVFEGSVMITSPIVIRGQPHTVIKGDVRIETKESGRCVLNSLHIDGSVRLYNERSLLKDVSITEGICLSGGELITEDTDVSGTLIVSNSTVSLSRSTLVLDRLDIINSMMSVTHSLVQLSEACICDKGDLTIMFTTLTETNGKDLFEVRADSELSLLNVIVTGDEAQRRISYGEGKTISSNVISLCGARSFECKENVNLPSL